MFIEHKALSPFLPHVREYVMKGLNEVSTPGSKFKASTLEMYAADVLERVGELDSSVKSLRMAVNFITNLNQTDKDATDVYRYHYENFLLRLTGTVDRAYRLVGTSLQLNPARYERPGGNRFVSDDVSSGFPTLYSCLQSIGAIAAKHKGPRNEVAHSKAFATRELGLLSAAEKLQLTDEESKHIIELTKDYFSEGTSELTDVIAEIIQAIKNLLAALEPLYEHVCKETPSQSLRRTAFDSR